MTYTTDVVVIGGGIAGAAAAYYLAKAGAKVTLVEKGIIAEGTGGCSGGALTLLDKTPGLLLELGQASLKLYETLEDELDYDFNYRNCGTLVPLKSEEERLMVETYFEPLVKEGLEIVTYSKEMLRSSEPELADDFLAGIFCPTDGIVDPVRLILGLTWGAKRFGAKVLIECEVQNLTLEQDQTITVHTNKGEFNASHVVNAAGVWSPKIAAYLGLDIPVIPRQGQLAFMEPGPTLLNSFILDAKYFDVKFESGSNVDSDSIGVATVVEQRGPYIMLGGSRGFVGMDWTPDDKVISRIIERGISFFPKLAQRRCVSKVACLRPYTADHYPVIGIMEAIPSFVFATGYEGDGIGLGPIAGKLVSELVLGSKPSPDIRDLSPNRFVN